MYVFLLALQSSTLLFLVLFCFLLIFTEAGNRVDLSLRNLHSELFGINILEYISARNLGDLWILVFMQGIYSLDCYVF